MKLPEFREKVLSELAEIKTTIKYKNEAQDVLIKDNKNKIRKIEIGICTGLLTILIVVVKIFFGG